MGEAVQVFDWQRMLWGDQPPLFLLEIVFRTTLIYLYALALLRWLGSRAIGQLSTIEFLLVIALGSAVGDAMFYPDVPLLHALVVITAVVFANKVLDIAIARSGRAEAVLNGVPEEAIRDGVICRGFFSSTALSTNELFQQLREHGIEHIGQVRRAYVETDGVLTVFRETGLQERPGLPIVPPWEIETPVPADLSAETGPVACRRCGHIDAPHPGLGRCANCGHDVWVVPRR